MPFYLSRFSLHRFFNTSESFKDGFVSCLGYIVTKKPWKTDFKNDNYTKIV